MHCVSLQGRTYHFRRRVPKDLQARFGKRELFRSLSTDRKREAYYLATLLNLASERLFALAREDENLTPEDLAAAARHWLATPMWQLLTGMRLGELSTLG